VWELQAKIIRRNARVKRVIHIAAHLEYRLDDCRAVAQISQRVLRYCVPPGTAKMFELLFVACVEVVLLPLPSGD
jgi:hypothetical protein